MLGMGTIPELEILLKGSPFLEMSGSGVSEFWEKLLPRLIICEVFPPFLRTENKSTCLEDHFAYMQACLELPTCHCLLSKTGRGVKASSDDGSRQCLVTVPNEAPTVCTGNILTKCTVDAKLQCFFLKSN